MKLFEQEIQHPSFGLMSINRTSIGNGHYMCGSDMKPTNIIRIVIEKDCIQAMSEHTGKHVYHGDKSHATRVEVEMTYSQFSNMICNMNVGDGTPCNVLFWGNEGQIEPYTENPETEFEFNYKKVIKELKDQSEKYAHAVEELKPLIEKLPKAKQAEILGVISKLEKSVTDSVPFFLKQCAETSEKIVNRAKTEVANFVDSAVHRVGLNVIAGGKVLESTNLLTSEVEDVAGIELKD